jgi:hypothetical protein
MTPRPTLPHFGPPGETIYAAQFPHTRARRPSAHGLASDALIPTPVRRAVLSAGLASRRHVAACWAHSPVCRSRARRLPLGFAVSWDPRPLFLFLAALHR